MFPKTNRRWSAHFSDVHKWTHHEAKLILIMAILEAQVVTSHFRRQELIPSFKNTNMLTGVMAAAEALHLALPLRDVLWGLELTANLQTSHLLTPWVFMVAMFSGVAPGQWPSVVGILELGHWNPVWDSLQHYFSSKKKKRHCSWQLLTVILWDSQETWESCSVQSRRWLS